MRMIAGWHSPEGPAQVVDWTLVVPPVLIRTPDSVGICQKLFSVARSSGVRSGTSWLCETRRGPSRTKLALQDKERSVPGHLRGSVPGQVGSTRPEKVRPGTSWLCKTKRGPSRGNFVGLSRDKLALQRPEKMFVPGQVGFPSTGECLHCFDSCVRVARSVAVALLGQLHVR